MKLPIGLLCCALLAAGAHVLSGCAVACIEDSTGTRCSAKSLQRFDGPPPAPLVFDHVPGAPVNIDVLYGNVIVQRSAGPKLEVHFRPFAYAGYDEKAAADRMLRENLRFGATAQGGLNVTVTRQGGSNGLGADVFVRLPDRFDGTLTILNRGGGPVNEFDVRVEAVGQARALSVTNNTVLGTCWIQGAPSVRSTTVRCGEDISVFDVSDQVNIENTDDSHDPNSPAITLRLHSVSPGSPGGRVTAFSGNVAATFPVAGGYVIDAKSPVKGTVREQGLPQSCKAQPAAPNAKLYTCGQGPRYELLAGTQPDYIGQPKDNNVILSFR